MLMSLRITATTTKGLEWRELKDDRAIIPPADTTVVRCCVAVEELEYSGRKLLSNAAVNTFGAVMLSAVNASGLMMIMFASRSLDSR